jgi:hypothetical protein
VVDGSKPWLRLCQATLLGIILLFAAWTRISGYNWDEGLQIHVDEVFVSKVALKSISLPPGTSFSTLLDPDSSPINPRTKGAFYVYGTFPLYIVKAVSIALYSITGDTFYNGLIGLQQTGRILAALFDVITTLLVFAIGRRLWDVWPGLFAAAFYGSAVLPIQTGHFFITDAFMATFMTAALFVSVLAIQTRSSLYVFLAALCVGWAAACKLTCVSIIILPLAVVLVEAIRTTEVGTRREGLLKTLASVGMLVGGVFLGLFMGDPFAVLDAPTYLAQVGEQTRIQAGNIDEWFTRKYVGTWPVLYPWGQLILLGVSPLVGIAGTAGLMTVVARTWRGHNWADGLLLAGTASYFATIGFVESKWVRYLLPLVPYLCLFASALVLWAYQQAARRNMGPATRVALPVVLLVSTFLGAVAVSSIFTSEHTQIKASRWIYSHIRQGARIGIEKTALEMPLRLPGFEEQRKGYTLVIMDPLSDVPSAEASANLHAQLKASDYLVLDATQAAETVPHLPWRYPVQNRYYDLLLGGHLGFSVALYSTSYPRIGNVEIADDGAWVDPSFMDSSHPPIWILKKDRNLSAAEWDAQFVSAVQQVSVPSRRKP